ncbi:hypothetical protein AB1N83_011398 [Pleurotus pulmonarius]
MVFGRQPEQGDKGILKDSLTHHRPGARWSRNQRILFRMIPIKANALAVTVHLPSDGHRTDLLLMRRFHMLPTRTYWTLKLGTVPHCGGPKEISTGRINRQIDSLFTRGRITQRLELGCELDRFTLNPLRGIRRCTIKGCSRGALVASTFHQQYHDCYGRCAQTPPFTGLSWDHAPLGLPCSITTYKLTPSPDSIVPSIIPPPSSVGS